MHIDKCMRDDHMNKIYCDTIIENFADNFSVIMNRKDDSLREVNNYTLQLNQPHNCFATCRKLSMKYLNGELDFYLSGSPFLKDILKHSKFWNNVSDDGRSINSNYGKLLLHDRNSHNFTQFEYALRCLLNNPQSKKAVMTVYRDQHAYVTNDNPCTMYLQFFIRNGSLNMFAKMRSNDIWFGIPYDVPFFVFIQYLMLTYLRKEKYPELRIGVYNHQAGSLHAYERNIDALTAITHKPLDATDQMDMFQEIIMKRVEEWIKQH